MTELSFICTAHVFSVLFFANQWQDKNLNHW